MACCPLSSLFKDAVTPCTKNSMYLLPCPLWNSARSTSFTYEYYDYLCNWTLCRAIFPGGSGLTGQEGESILLGRVCLGARIPASLALSSQRSTTVLSTPQRTAETQLFTRRDLTGPAKPSPDQPTAGGYLDYEYAVRVLIVISWLRRGQRHCGGMTPVEATWG